MPVGVSITREAIEQIALSGFAFLGASPHLQKLMEDAFEIGDRFFELDIDRKANNSLPLRYGLSSLRSRVFSVE